MQQCHSLLLSPLFPSLSLSLSFFPPSLPLHRTLPFGPLVIYFFLPGSWFFSPPFIFLFPPKIMPQKPVIGTRAVTFLFSCLYKAQLGVGRTSSHSRCLYVCLCYLGERIQMSTGNVHSSGTPLPHIRCTSIRCAVVWFMCKCVHMSVYEFTIDTKSVDSPAH